MKTVTIFLVIGLLAGLGGGLYSWKLTVEAEARQVAELRQRIIDDRAAIAVMRTDEVYLSRVDRLQDAALGRLKLSPAMPDQLAVAWGDIPFRLDPSAPVDEVDPLMPKPTDPSHGALFVATFSPETKMLGERP